MGHYKRYGWIVLYGIALSAVIIYSFKGTGEPVKPQEPDKVTLTFRHFWTKEHDLPVLRIFQDIVNEYERTHPNVKVNFEGIDQTVHREQKLKSEMVTGTPPEMFVLFAGAEMEPYIRSNRLMDLSGFVEQNKLSFQDLHLWKGEDGQGVYGLPFEGHAEPLYYNRRIFGKLGIEPPETLDDLNAAVRKLRASGYTPFALGNEEQWPAGVYAHYLMDRFAGPELIEKLVRGEEGASFRNGGYLKAFDLLQQWSKEGALGGSPGSASTEEAIRMFTHGEAAMYVGGSWDITLFRSDSAPDGFERDIGVMPFPSLEAGEARSIAGGYTIGIGLSSNLTEAQREAALEFLKAVYTEEAQARLVYEAARIPSMTIDYDPVKTGPVFNQVAKFMQESESSFVAYDNVLSPEVKKSFLSVLDKLLSNAISGEEALMQLDKASEAYWKLRRSS